MHATHTDAATLPTPHVITLHPVTRGVETYSCGPLRVTSRGPDALRTLLRMMVAEGMSGPAKIVGIDGKHRMTVRAIEQAAKLSVSEGDRGLRIGPYRELPGFLADAA